MSTKLLSFSKLESMLRKYDYQIWDTYGTGSTIEYFSCLSRKEGYLFLVRINSSYTVKAHPTIPLTKHRNVDDEDDNHSTNDEERGFAIQPKHIGSIEDEDEFKDGYKALISTTEHISEAPKGLHQLKQQVKRIYRSLAGTEYTIALQHNKQLVMMFSSDDVDCYSITVSDTRIFVLTDLRYLISNPAIIAVNVVEIKTSLYSIFDRVRHTSIKSLTKLRLERSSEKIVDNIKRYRAKHSKMKHNLRAVYKEQSKLEDMNRKTENDGQRQRILRRIEVLQSTVQEIVEYMVIADTKIDEWYLQLDQVFYENMVYVNKVIRNLNSLGTI